MNGFQIVTERLVLTPLGTAYLDSVNEYALDYENTRYMCHLPKQDSDETLSFLKDVEAEAFRHPVRAPVLATAGDWLPLGEAVTKGD